MSRRADDKSIIVALGGNLAAGGQGLRQSLGAALELLPGHGLRPTRCSRFWRSAAWPDPSEPAFLNAVALVETALDPAQAMSALHRIEALFGRERSRPNAARILDLDLIAYGRQVCAGDLVLPHPRAAERLFVMGPLAELAPGWTHPVSGKRAADLARDAAVGRDARPLPEEPGESLEGIKRFGR
ncbi:2-amino-4-hydroxy-6-hydroxymethyldihydropteridine diphosphokinase [Caulobacter sp. S45]|uniref:2-amino-4-hydroxy-6- hydroxymethyldihydropteridine diphosphokinase n=1 Tax=Caulobacter sp. S45 TaxID=1641861 RepID=UPI002111D6C5|nr:2-amino-4-hydroxy-6-hydroxymethyldihydropteridine diphosphokinase [Caulobacter sp. S45]